MLASALDGVAALASPAATRSEPGSAPVPPASQPVVVGDCAGWLHWDGNAAGPGGDVAVLLCPAIGWDGLHSYHCFRLLADRLAVAGYPVLRFQYPSIGDSAEVATPDDHWSAWQHSVDQAAAWLRASTGARRLILVGLRIGATLATLAAERRDDVETLMLLAPVLRGKSYVRQLEMEARLENGPSAPVQDGLELNELRLSADTVRRMAAIDLRRSKLRAGLKVAVLPQAPSQLVESCVQTWTESGVEVHSVEFAGLEPMLQEAIHVDLPAPDFTRLLDWTSLHAASASAAGRACPPPPRAALQLPGCTESGLRFGGDAALFGVLCRPAVPVGKKAVIMVNSGRDPHYGIGRFAEELARRMAAEGVTSLRMDFTGLGDSPAAPGQGDVLSPLFEIDRTDDLRAAIDALERLGYTEFAVQGLCSGAFHAYRAALAEKRIGSVLLVNLPVFEWTGGDSVKGAIWKSASPSRVLAKLTERETWKRALQGRVGMRAVVVGQAHHIVECVRVAVARRLQRFGAPIPPAGPERDMATLAARKLRAQFLYSAGDPGLGALSMVFGHEGERLAAMAGTEIHVIHGVNHVLSTQAMRNQFTGLMVGFLAAARQPRATTVRTIVHDHSLDHPRPDQPGRPTAEPDARAA